MTEIQFTGKSLRSAEDLKRIIKDAEWQVKYHKEEVQKAADTLYARQLALDALQKEYEYAALTPHQQEQVDFAETPRHLIPDEEFNSQL